MSVYVPGTTETDQKKQNRSLQQLGAAVEKLQAQFKATGTVTLAVSPATSTTVTDSNCSSTSVPLLVPKTAHAAAEDGNGTRYVSAVAEGSFTITHASSSQTDRTYLYALFG
jgi:hypothetical protein